MSNCLVCSNFLGIKAKFRYLAIGYCSVIAVPEDGGLSGLLACSFDFANIAKGFFI
jgi:hypothetical protein